MGLPLIELRFFSGEWRLVVEYARRVGVPELNCYPVFGTDFAHSWALGGRRRVTPIDGQFERVVHQDSVNFGTSRTRFARVIVGLENP